MIINVIMTKGDTDLDWPFCCIATDFDDTTTSISIDINQALNWCKLVDIPVSIINKTFYFKTIEDQTAFALRWSNGVDSYRSYK